MAAVDGASPDSSKYAWKVPRGCERDPNAPCYYLGAYMNQDIKRWSPGMLRHVSESEIRDGSVPMTRPSPESTEADADEAHKPDPVPHLQHVNHPRAGETIGEAFQLHYVDPTLRENNQKIRLQFRPTLQSKEASTEMVELEMYGNQFKGSVSRPAAVSAGPYTLTVQMHLEGGKIVDKASVNVVFA